MHQDLPVLKQHKLYLQDFWYEYGSLSGQKGVSRKSKTQTLDALVKLGELKLYYNNTHTRKQFDKKKNKLKKFQGFKKCFACKGAAEVRHHIIWLKHGGRNHKRNVLALCRLCHAEIHPWLR